MADKEQSEIQKQEAPLPEGVERTQEGRVFVPSSDIYETNENVVLVADMPGVAADNVDITLENGVLTIKGRVDNVAVEGDIVYQEYDVGDFQRSFSLSDQIDGEKIQASMNAGVLTVTLPKATPSRKRIEVQAG